MTAGSSSASGGMMSDPVGGLALDFDIPWDKLDAYSRVMEQEDRGNTASLRPSLRWSAPEWNWVHMLKHIDMEMVCKYIVLFPTGTLMICLADLSYWELILNIQGRSIPAHHIWNLAPSSGRSTSSLPSSTKDVWPLSYNRLPRQKHRYLLEGTRCKHYRFKNTFFLGSTRKASTKFL
jgi:hypothetical protein